MIVSPSRMYLEKVVDPWHSKKECEYSWGEEIAGYTLRLGANWCHIGTGQWHTSAGSIRLSFGHPILCATVEHIRIPTDCLGVFFGKSSYAREGIRTYVTPLEPGWEGILTVEVATDYQGGGELAIGQGIGQLVLFEGEFEGQYQGRYQNQKAGMGRIGV